MASIALISCNTTSTLTGDMEEIADIIVSLDGSGDFTKVQEAINAAPDYGLEPTVIFIKNGVYHEKIIVQNEKSNLILVGETVDSTILTYDHRSMYTRELNTFTSHSVRVDASDVSFYNLTIENPARGSQAVALHGNGDRQTFVHCKILGWQDTYYSDMRSRNYFKDCFIEGATDYIFGFGIVLFDSCVINTLGFYVTAASTPQQYDFGMVFRNCHFTADSSVKKISLGRPWFDYARTVLLNCYEPEQLIPEGWSRWGGREHGCFYREYNCYGPGSDTSQRISFGKQLTDEEAALYSKENIFSADNYPENDDDYTIYLEKRFVGHKNEPYLEDIVFRADGDWPEKPAEDWTPDPEEDEVYEVVYAYSERFIK